MRSFSLDWRLRLAAWRQMKHDLGTMAVPDLLPALREHFSTFVYGHLNERFFHCSDELCPEAAGRHLAEASYLESKAREILEHWQALGAEVGGYLPEYCAEALRHFDSCPYCRRQSAQFIIQDLELLAGYHRLMALVRQS